MDAQRFKEALRASFMNADYFCMIDENLYLGSYAAVCHLEKVATVDLPSKDEYFPKLPAPLLMPTADILSRSAILTVNSFALPERISNLCRAVKYISLEDSYEVDILSYCDEAYDFIHENLQKGNLVLVHCTAGISRSTTILTTYLMRAKGMGVEKALEMITEKRPIAMPNENFLEQLHMYENMGCKIDPSNVRYRHWRLKMFMRSSEDRNDKIGSILHGSPDMSSQDCFCCRICRCPLFARTNLLNHTGGKKPFTNFTGSFADPNPEQPPVICSLGELFIEPVDWMREEILQHKGKLYCPKCKKKVGTFSWSGEPCPCGMYVTPAFHMDKGKVESRKT